MRRLRNPCLIKDGFGLWLATFSPEQLHDPPQNPCRRQGPKIKAKRLVLPQRCSPGAVTPMEKLSPGWASGYRQTGCTGAESKAPAQKMPLTPEHPKLHLHTRASNTATSRISDRTEASQARRPRHGLTAGSEGAPAAAAGPPLSAARTGAQANAGMLQGRTPTRSRAGRELCTGTAGPGGHYLSDGISEEQHARPPQEPPAGSRLRQRHGRGRTSAGSGGGRREEAAAPLPPRRQTGRAAGRPRSQTEFRFQPRSLFYRPFHKLRAAGARGGRAGGPSPHTPRAGWRRFQQNARNVMVFIHFKETLPS